MKAINQKISYDYDIDISVLEISEDHIHMVVGSEPKISPSKIMEIVKGISARELFRLNPDVKRQ
ncbi:MAG: IS200/IS605 family transposase [Pseudoalteromonas sp.]|uniref:IS200/IS605 family transposase n=1 Tax=Pseudoalteromonas nigrifaciens TaxID=28109 RepID=UPI003FBA4AB8